MERQRRAGTRAVRDALRAVRSWPSVLVGMVIPALALLGGVTLLSGSGERVLGWPVLYLWVFLCFPLTTVCLWVSWRVFDRPHYLEPERETEDAP